LLSAVHVFSTDCNCVIGGGRFRVFSGYIKEVDAKPGPTSWGSKMTFANLMGEYSNGGGQSIVAYLKKYHQSDLPKF